MSLDKSSSFTVWIVMNIWILMTALAQPQIVAVVVDVGGDRRPLVVVGVVAVAVVVEGRKQLLWKNQAAL
jgi:hypothetical protein